MSVTEVTQDEWDDLSAFEPGIVYCSCGARYTSQTKLKALPGGAGFEHHSQTPCPGCGESVNNMFRVEHPPETCTLKR